MDHCIVANARKNIVIGSAERLPLQLKPEILTQCGGSHVGGLRVAKRMASTILRLLTG